jgi:hypothetical protein
MRRRRAFTARVGSGNRKAIAIASDMPWLQLPGERPQPRRRGAWHAYWNFLMIPKATPYDFTVLTVMTVASALSFMEELYSGMS